MHIDLLLRPKPRSTSIIAAVIALLAATAWLAMEASRHEQAAELAMADLRHLQVQKQKPAAPKPKPAEVEANKRWSSLQAELAFSWYPVFRALEQASNSDIELLEFRPDKGGRRVMLRGEARDQGALISYVSALAAQPVFSELYLAHQKTLHKQGMDVLAFEIRSEIMN